MLTSQEGRPSARSTSCSARMPSALPTRHSPAGSTRRSIQPLGREIGRDIGAGVDPPTLAIDGQERVHFAENADELTDCGDRVREAARVTRDRGDGPDRALGHGCRCYQRPSFRCPRRPHGRLPCFRDRSRHRPGHCKHGLRRDLVRRPRRRRARAGHGAHRPARARRAAPGGDPGRDPGADRDARARRPSCSRASSSAPTRARSCRSARRAAPRSRSAAPTASPAPNTRPRRSRPRSAASAPPARIRSCAWCKQLLSLPAAPESDHAADALALALCHAWSARAGERFARARAAR